LFLQDAVNSTFEKQVTKRNLDLQDIFQIYLNADIAGFSNYWSDDLSSQQKRPGWI